VPSSDAAFRIVLSELRRRGILLESDAKLPSITAIVAGEPIRGSWWGHAKGHEIFHVSRQMASHKDVLVTKLVSRKVTYVHRRLWPLIVAIGSARQDWQMSSLSRPAKELLVLVDKAGRIRTDDIRSQRKLKGMRIGDAARELEVNLLIHSQEIHTEAGVHAKVMESWQSWSKRVGLLRKKMRPDDAKEQLERLLAKFNREFGAKGSLPWN